MKKEKYSIYVTLEYHTCWEVEASSVEEAEQLHDFSHSKMKWKCLSEMDTTHIERSDND